MDDSSGETVGDSQLACSRCSKRAVLQCPKCIELKLPRVSATFCSQECFKAAWSTHKLVHTEVRQLPMKAESPQQQVSEALSKGWLYCFKKGQTWSAQLPFFDWTGPLRPYPISPRRLVPENIICPDWAADGLPKIEQSSDLQNRVEIKTPEQIEKMRETCRVAREVLDAAARAIRPGVTTDEIDDIVHKATIAAGGYPSPLNYYFFPKSCCTSVNEIICHGIPDSRRLEEGDIVNVDVSVYLNGYHGDLNETFFVGKVDEASEQLVRCTYECLEKAIAIVKPGVRYREIGEVINRHACLSGLSVVKSYCGHGIGELFHCAPNIPHYSRNKAVGVMKAGQTFTIEPMINAGLIMAAVAVCILMLVLWSNLSQIWGHSEGGFSKGISSVGNWRDRMWPDGWTDVTTDGKRSAQFEHTLLVTETWVDVLTGRLPTSPNVFPWLC